MKFKAPCFGVGLVVGAASHKLTTKPATTELELAIGKSLDAKVGFALTALGLGIAGLTKYDSAGWAIAGYGLGYGALGALRKKEV